MQVKTSRRGGLLALVLLAAACGNNTKQSRVTVVVDGQGLDPAVLSSIRTIRLHVDRDLQQTDSSYVVPAGAFDDGHFEVSYNPLAKSGLLHVIITALDSAGSLVATTSGDVSIKTGQNATVTVMLAEMSADALLVLEPPTVDFGDVVLGYPAGHKLVTVRNAGGAPTGMLSSFLGGDTTSFVVDPTTTCDGLALLPGDTCMLAIEFRPIEAGPRAAQLLVSATPGGDANAPLSGTGVTASVLAIDPVAADMGAVVVGQTGPPTAMTVHNTGGTTTGTLGVTVAGPAAAEMAVQSDGCSGKALPPGGVCQMTVALQPTSAGEKMATLTVAGLLGPAAAPFLALSTGGASDSASVTLTGRGVAAAALVVEPIAQDLGTVVTGGQSSAAFSVRNPGGLPTGSITMTVGGTNAAEMALGADDCTGGVLAPGASCTVVVNFVPTSIGAKTAALNAHAAPAGDAKATLTATVAAPGAITIAPTKLDFGGIPVGASSDASVFTVTNTGGVATGALALALGGSGAMQFVRGTDGCTGQTLAPSATCTIAYVFHPTAAGNNAASLTALATPGGLGAASLTGRGLAPAMLASSATAPFGTVDVGTTATAYKWTITNQGDTATGALATVLGGNSADFVVTNGCSGALAGGTSCTISVAAAPATGGDKAMTVTVTGAPGGSVVLTATATARPAQLLTVALSGNGMGNVASEPAGISCGTTCSAGYRYGTSVMLTATASAGSTFTGWSGACTGTGVCVVSTTAATNVSAAFALNKYALSVKTSGAATGTVASVPAGIDCGADCSESYDNATSVTLTATPASGFAFGGWGGACTGTATCVVSMTQARSVSATFTQNAFALNVTVAGNGKVGSDVVGIDCGSDCGEAYASGQVVKLTPSAGTGSTFSGWTGACTGATVPCVVTMTQAQSVTATFVLNPEILTVKIGGNGQITSKPPGIDCAGTALSTAGGAASDCTETYLYGDVIVLTATPGTGQQFGRWSGGGCTGTAPSCTVTMTANVDVSASFVPQTFTLSVKTIGAGAAGAPNAAGAPVVPNVISDDGVISCPTGKVCSNTYAYGTTVTLSTTPTGVYFLGWDYPNCVPQAPPLLAFEDDFVQAVAPPPTYKCTLTMTAPTTVSARYELPVTVSVKQSSTVLGTFTSTPVGIDCGPAGANQICSNSFPTNTQVSVAATPPSLLFTFSGWTAGPCAGVTPAPNPCTFQLGTTSVGLAGGFSSIRIIVPPGGGVLQ